MEVYQTDNHYIVLDGEFSLWCSRHDGSLEAKPGSELCHAWNPVCIGLVYGVIGKIKIHPESEWRLLLIGKETSVGEISAEHDSHSVYKVDRIAVMPLTPEHCEVELDRCAKHHFGMKRTERIVQQADSQGKSLQKTWNQLKSAAENVKPKKKDVKDKEKYEKRIMEEFIKMYNETSSFFYSKTYDLTNSIQRQYSSAYDKTATLWTRVDSRFFWNLHMMTELTEMKTPLADHWVVPIIQGSVDIQICPLDFSSSSRDLSPMMPTKVDKDPITYTMILISRRSRHRAGTRSKRRGLDETGACANYVETEQIIEFVHHRVSFVQTRGSIPVFWSQTGVKYRPPPKLDKGEAETHEAFRRHFDEQLALYRTVNVVALTELVGKEKVIGDAYLDNVLTYNSQDVTYITFDFHEYCRGMKFENVSILTSAIKDIVKHMRYCWVDRKGMICEQRGVFRVNCVDCLDRTNVVQTAIARIVMETQCRKLGLLAPEETLPENCRQIFQQMWANNGDAISKQYAGTVALKGDYTRTGERKISGMMKDGVNSANRYYLRFKDTYRQAAIDVTHGYPVSEDILYGKLKVPEDDVREMFEKEENVKALIEDCKKMLIVEPEECLGGWSLVNADPITGDNERQEMDIILLLSQRAVYVAWYEDEEEQVNRYQRIFLEDIEMLEIGAEHSLFKTKSIVMRLHYRHYADEGFFHTLKAPGTRLFNNLVIPVKTPDEAKEQLNVVCEAFIAAQNLLKLELVVEEKPKLDKRKTRPHPEVNDIHQQLQENSLSKIKLPRDISAQDIPSGPSSRGSSPRMPRKISPSLPRRNSQTAHAQVSPDERSDNGGEKAKLHKLKQLAPQSKAAVKSLLNNMSNVDLQVPKLNMKLVSKLKSGGAGASRLFSKMPGTSIFYKNDPNVDEPDVFIDEPRDLVYDPKRDRHRTLSKDDSSIDESVDLTDAQLEKEVVMLDSCGILAANAKQIIQSPSCSFDEPDGRIEKSSRASPDEHTSNDESKKERGTNVFDINDLQLRRLNINKENTSVSDVNEPGPSNTNKEELEVSHQEERSMRARSASYQSTFTCFCRDKATCPHQNVSSEEQDKEEDDVWVKRSDATEPQEKRTSVPPHQLNLGQKRVEDNSEADKILAKYSKAKDALGHPNMRTSMSDSALSSHSQVTVNLPDKHANDGQSNDDSPKSFLDFELEINTKLQKKLPNLLQSAKMPRKSHRIYENLKQHIERRLEDKVCHSTIIFV